MSTRSFLKKAGKATESKSIGGDIAEKSMQQLLFVVRYYKYLDTLLTKLDGDAQLKVASKIDSVEEILFYYCILGISLRWSECIPVITLKIPQIMELSQLIKAHKNNYDINALLIPFNSSIKQNISEEFTKLKPRSVLVESVIKVMRETKYSNMILSILKENLHRSSESVAEMILAKFEKNERSDDDVIMTEALPIPEITALAPRPEAQPTVPNAPKKKRLLEGETAEITTPEKLRCQPKPENANNNHNAKKAKKVPGAPKKRTSKSK